MNFVVGNNLRNCDVPCASWKVWSFRLSMVLHDQRGFVSGSWGDESDENEKCIGW